MSVNSKNPLSEALETFREYTLRQLMTCLPAKVTAFNPSTQLAQIELGIKRIINGEPVTIPVIDNVPVQFPGDDWVVTFEVQPGCEGIAIFSQRAIDTWLEQGGPVAPHETHMFDPQDAFFLPGLRSKPGALPSFANDGVAMTAGDRSYYVHLRNSGNVEIEAANVDVNASGDVTATAGGDATVEGANITATATGNLDAMAAAATVTASTITLAGNVTVTGNLSVTGTMQNNGTNVGGTHTHPYTDDGDPMTTGAPQ